MYTLVLLGNFCYGRSREVYGLSIEVNESGKGHLYFCGCCVVFHAWCWYVGIGHIFVMYEM